METNYRTTPRSQKLKCQKCLILLFLLLNGTLYCQSFTVKGQVKNQADAPLSGDLLLTGTDSVKLIKAINFYDGQFEISDVQEQDFVLMLYCTGYKDTLLLLTGKGPVMNLGTIKLNPVKQLDEVTITARTPIFEKTKEGSRINVENTLLSSCPSAAELLAKMPGLTVGANRVTLFGKGEALIYLNGRQIPYERFISIPPAMIKSIDIISNPGARYDAKGMAVINVTLKKNVNEGFLGNIIQNSTLGRHFMSLSSANLSYRKKKISFTGDYGINLGKDWNENHYSTIVKHTSGIYRTESYYNENTKLANVSNYRCGIAYQLNKNTDLSAQYDGLYGLYNLGVQNRGVTTVPNGEQTVIAMKNNGKTLNQNHSGNINFNSTTDTLGSTLFAGVQYCNFENILYDQIKENISHPGNSFTSGNRINDGNNRIELYTAQADRNKIFKNSAALEYGIKFSSISNRGKVKFLSKSEEEMQWTENPLYANSFIYKEQISAAYVTFSASYKKIDYSIACRAEHSLVDGFSHKLNQKVIDTNYLNFFPNARVTWNISKKWASTISYSHRINRPIYQNIDPFVWYIDSLTSIQGNSRLIPELIHSLEWNLSWKNFVLKASYANTRNSMRYFGIQGNSGTNSVLFSTFNLQQFEQFTCGLELPVERKKFNSYTTIALNRNVLTDKRPFINLRPLQPQLYIYSYNQFIIRKKLTIDLSGEYYGAGCDGITERSPYYYFTMGVSTSFFKKQLSCQLTYNDFLRTAKIIGNKTLGHITSEYAQRFNTHYLRLTLNWKVGSLRNTGYKNKTVNDNEFNRIRQ